MAVVFVAGSTMTSSSSMWLVVVCAVLFASEAVSSNRGKNNYLQINTLSYLFNDVSKTLFSIYDIGTCRYKNNFGFPQN